MWRLFFLLWFAGVFVGCDHPVVSFAPNEVFSLTLAKSRSVVTDAAKADAAAVTEELFGTPDVPRVPPSAAAVISLDRLVRAAGPVSSEKDGTHLGLYREHCVTCHGVSGGGAGPASLYQKPHPRNFRHGVFKWKSTERSAKPTRDDLRSIVQHGAPGSAMPSFAAVEPDDIDALVDYVMYLSLRGEFERRSMAAAIDDLGYGESENGEEEQVAADLRLAASGETDGAEVVAEVLDRVVGDWIAAPEQVVAVTDPDSLGGESLAESIARGNEIFHGKIANCVGCHGPGGNGEAVLVDFDDWGKEYSTRLGLTPSDRDDMRPFRKAGALPPRPAEPRNLTQGVYRGGGDGATLYRRIREGIAGTPMPGIELVAEEDGRGLTSDQVWDLVRYLQSLDPDGPST
ncbi:cytochrome c [Rubripirellula reticaptiva]|uniref:Cytochrome c n=1 Tax=Rubripirellula reticaptiva TaxID=2528013 RepID=A0A5C6FCI4_9BACT|nr:cytochrome c [Rubripirellula reticaptiva]TWU57349.1 Cytochrome c [Rubripirellula reticaptiva]